MSAVSAWVDGLRRVRRAPALVILVWLCTLAASLSPMLAMRDAIINHLDQSLEADAAADGVNQIWMEEFRGSSGELGKSLRPDVIGFATVLDNTSALADTGSRPIPAVVAGLVFLGVVWFVTPGVIVRLAADRPVHARQFLATCGACSGRMVRLAIVSAVVYGALFFGLHATLLDDVFGVVTRDMTVERTAFVVRLALYIVFFGVVAAVNLLFDFAKVRMVIEDRHSVLGSLSSAIVFISMRPLLAIGVYALNVLLLGCVFAAYFLVAPGAGSADWTMWFGLVVSQAYIAERVFTKLAFWSGEVAAVQRHCDCREPVREAVIT